MEWIAPYKPTGKGQIAYWHQNKKAAMEYPWLLRFILCPNPAAGLLYKLKLTFSPQ
jgi:hypothetical protein